MQVNLLKPGEGEGVSQMQVFVRKSRYSRNKTCHVLLLFCELLPIVFSVSSTSQDVVTDDDPLQFACVLLRLDTLNPHIIFSIVDELGSLCCTWMKECAAMAISFLLLFFLPLSITHSLFIIINILPPYVQVHHKDKSTSMWIIEHILFNQLLDVDAAVVAGGGGGGKLLFDGLPFLPLQFK